MVNDKRLLQLEKEFAVLKNLKKLKEQERQCEKMELTLRDIFGFEVIFEVTNKPRLKDNCMVLCYPKMPLELKEYHPKKNPELNFVHIQFGTELLKLLDPRESIAILFHEYKHWYYSYESALPWIDALVSLFKRISGMTGLSSSIATGGLMLIPTLLILTICSTINTKISHSIELGCDEWAVKYGYGPDLYSAFKKLKEHIESGGKPSLGIRFLAAIIKYVFTGSSHPDMEKRMEKIKELLKGKYADIYSTKAQKKRIEKYYKIEL